MTEDEKKAQFIINKAYHLVEEDHDIISITEPGLRQAIAEALTAARREQAESDLKLIDAYWKFDNDQKPLTSWHEKQELLIKIRESVKP